VTNIRHRYNSISVQYYKPNGALLNIQVADQYEKIESIDKRVNLIGITLTLKTVTEWKDGKFTFQYYQGSLGTCFHLLF